MSIFGWLTGSDAIDKAAHTQMKASKQATALTKEGWANASGILSPGANYQVPQNKIWDLLGLNGAQNEQNAFGAYQTSPGQQWAQQQGEQAQQRAASAGGGLASGRTLAAANSYGQGVAQQGYGDWFSRLNDAYKTSLGTAGTLANGYTNNASNLANIALNNGQTQAGYQVQKGQIVPNIVAGTAKIAADLLGSYMSGGASSIY